MTEQEIKVVLRHSEDSTERTALVHIDPALDPRVHALSSEVLELVQRAESRTVASDADVRVTTEDLSVIKGLMDSFEAKRKEFTAPLNGYLKDINATFKEFTGPLEEANRLNKSKVLAWDAEQKRIIAQQKHINDLKMEAARVEMELRGELSEPVNLVEVSPEPPAHYRTPAGMLGKVLTWQWEISDFGLLPDMFKVPDAAKIKKVVQAGGTIPGVRAWQEESLRMTGAR